jgi:hypothetical protein
MAVEELRSLKLVPTACVGWGPVSSQASVGQGLAVAYQSSMCFM